MAKQHSLAIRIGNNPKEKSLNELTGREVKDLLIGIVASVLYML